MLNKERGRCVRCVRGCLSRFAASFPPTSPNVQEIPSSRRARLAAYATVGGGGTSRPHPRTYPSTAGRLPPSAPSVLLDRRRCCQPELAKRGFAAPGYILPYLYHTQGATTGRGAGRRELFPGVSGYRRSVRRSITTSRLPAGEGSSRGPRKLIRRLRPRLVSAVNRLAGDGAQVCDPEACQGANLVWKKIFSRKFSEMKAPHFFLQAPRARISENPLRVKKDF